MAQCSPSTPGNKAFIIFNLAVGGDWPGSPNASTVFPCIIAC